MDKIEALQIALDLIYAVLIDPRDCKDNPELTKMRSSAAYHVLFYMLAHEIEASEKNEAEMYEEYCIERRKELMKEMNDINDSLGHPQRKYKTAKRNWAKKINRPNRATAFCPY